MTGSPTSMSSLDVSRDQEYPEGKIIPSSHYFVYVLYCRPSPFSILFLFCTTPLSPTIKSTPSVPSEDLPPKNSSFLRSLLTRCLSWCRTSRQHPTSPRSCRPCLTHPNPPLNLPRLVLDSKINLTLLLGVHYTECGSP